ncbi:hypothetical protein CSPX01_09681 [Colletotrichum filicis]|nr:hypothetical protein CSPX01_09681 [Colletotrichum filicis]
MIASLTLRHPNLVLPIGSKIVTAESYGDSVWTQTGRMTVELPDGDVKQYFLKVSYFAENGRQLCRGEHYAISLINALVPGMVPRAVAWGKYSFSPPDTFFFIEEFHDLDMSLPNPRKLAQRAVQLHSQVSPNSKFGFEVATFDGIAPHPEGWEISWRVYFTRVLRKSVETDAAANGIWPELSKAAEHLLEFVVPGLLDPLQLGPNPIEPRLIHGDLWGGNIGTDEETGEIIFLDVGCFYGHNELDLGMWRRYGAQNLGQRYLDEYKRIFPPSEPQEGFDDRNRLYSMKFDLNASAGTPNEKARNTAFNNMLYLIEKYIDTPVEGLPKYDKTKDPSAGSGYIYANK